MFIKLHRIDERWTAGEKIFFLTEIHVNPNQILYMSEDTIIYDLVKEGKINLGLNSRASFTNIKLSNNGLVENITVVGDPPSIEEKVFKRTTRKLLRD